MRDKPQGLYQTYGFVASEVGAYFRPMSTSDLEDIMMIERASFSYPWSPAFFLQELRVQCARSMLALIGGRIVGYIIYWILPDEIDIHNLAVSPDSRRRGIGRALLKGVVNEARRHGSRRVTLEVRKSNELAQRLYESLGFEMKSVRKGYYTDDGEDALAMALDLGR